LLSLDHLVELTQITDPTYFAVLFGDDKRGTCLFALLLRNEDAKGHEMVEFMFERGQVNAGHGIWSCVHGLCVGFDVNVNLFMGVDAKRAIKEVLMTLEDVEQVTLLTGSEVLLVLNDVSDVHPFILCVEDVGRIELKPILAEQFIFMLDEI
jgi:hypothetical protein